MTNGTSRSLSVVTESLPECTFRYRRGVKNKGTRNQTRNWQLATGNPQPVPPLFPGRNLQPVTLNFKL